MYLIAPLVILALILGFVAVTRAWKGTEHTTVAHVTDKERVCDGSTNGNSTCQYLVYTDRGTFKVTDSHMIGVFWRTNSSDVYGRIRKDHTYRFKLIGWRFGLTSTYPNIETATEVSQ